MEHKEWLWKSCLGAVNHQMCPCAEVAEVWVTACQGTLLSPGNEGLFLSPGARLISISSSTLSAPSPRFAGMQRGAGAKLQGHCLGSELSQRLLGSLPLVQDKGEIRHCPASPAHSGKNTEKEEERGGEEKGELIMSQYCTSLIPVNIKSWAWLHSHCRNTARLTFL